MKRAYNKKSAFNKNSSSWFSSYIHNFHFYTLGAKKSNREAIGKLGDIGHLRKLLPDDLSETLKKNRMYWLTDRTPHESLPVKEQTYRQFFRLVTSQVSLWYEDHSTPNPNGIVPDPKITKIVKGNKFDPEGVVIIG